MNIVKESLWAGSVNAQIVYGSHEYLVELHRNSYFPLHYAEIVHYLSILSLNPQLESTPVWLEHDNTPLKWNIPIGVLYDAFHSSTDSSSIWKLTLFASSDETPYPDQHIIPFPTPIMGEQVNYTQIVYQILINQLKQSCYVLRGSSRAILGMSEDDTKALWKAIQQHDYDMYQTTMKKTVLETEMARKIPIKLYRMGLCILSQVPVSPYKEDGAPNTLNDILTDESLHNSKILIQGIEADVFLSMEVFQVWSQFRHLDNFLYLLIV